METKVTFPTHTNQSHLILYLGLMIVGIAALSQNYIFLAATITVPFLFLLAIKLVQSPYYCMIIIFIFNYFLMAIARYTKLTGLSLFVDILLVFTFIITLISSKVRNDIPWKRAINWLFIAYIIWMLYCLVEVVNPTANTEAWFFSRMLMFYPLFAIFFVSIILTQYKHLKQLLFLFSILTLLGISKALIQKFIGFDLTERIWLNQGGAKTHIIATGIRYFSFFTDASNFGSNMGFAGIVFCITAYYIKNKISRIYYLIVGLFSFFGMFISGTRGAMAIPLVGLFIFIVLSKNLKAFLSGGFILTAIYIFFAFTSIGQGNPQIRRMRTAFSPTEDASYNVRKENQKLFAEYLKDKPYGEGLGLSGVENKRFGERYTTIIPTDSWYVKIWVETGIVGLSLYLILLLSCMAWCAYIIMFRLKNKQLRGLLTGLLCGVAGLSVSAYGNAFFGQFPTFFLVFISLTLIQNGLYYDKEIENMNIKQIE